LVEKSVEVVESVEDVESAGDVEIVGFVGGREPFDRLRASREQGQLSALSVELQARNVSLVEKAGGSVRLVPHAYSPAMGEGQQR
jgi:hypothetical protein